MLAKKLAEPLFDAHRPSSLMPAYACKN